MNRPLFSELSDTDKIALLIECAERYSERGGMPESMRRREIAGAMQGIPAEQIKTLGSLVGFLAGWALIALEEVGADLNDPDYARESRDEEPLPDSDLRRIAASYLFANSESLERELEARDDAELVEDLLPTKKPN